jgi:multiple sugar transport system permease protein
MLPLLAYFLLPLFWLLVASTKTSTDLFSTFGLWFSGHFDLLSNLRQLFHYNHGIYTRWLANTAIYSTASAVGAALLATAGGYALGKFRFRGAKLTFALILGSIMVPSTALVIPTYLLFSHIGLINTPWAVILPSLVNPFGLYLMRVYAATSIPDEMLEAARVDGAGELRTLAQVAMPLLAPGFVTVLLFSFVATWNNYFLPLVVLSDPKLYPVTVGLANMNATANAGSGAQVLFPLVIVGALVAIIPLIVAFLALQRYWRSGLALGSIR